MKNIKTALSLALLAVAPTIYAQNIDTKAPAEPGFMVTLNVTDKGAAADTVWIRDYKNTKDSVILKGNQVKYGSYIRLGLKAQAGQTIDSLKVGAKKAIWTGSVDAKTILGTLIFEAGKPNLYSLPLGQIKEETNVTVTWKEKESWNLTFENTTQTVNTDGGATAVTVKDNGTSNTDIIKGYYKTKACAEADKISSGASDIKAAGTYYVKLQADETADKKGLDMVIPLVINNKLALTVADSDKPKCEDATLREGQPLSVATITGGICKYGEREIKGTWAWADPNQKLVKGTTTSYTAVFTPDSSAIYNTKTESITVSALYVATVTVEQSAGGTVAIKDATPDNKYVGTTSAYADITATATPAKGYKFVSWVSPADANNSNDTENMEVAKEKTVTAVPDGTVFKAAFAKATRKVTISSASNGTVQVLNGATAITSDTQIPYGTNLTIVATPASGKQVKSVSYTYKATDGATGTPTVANNFVVGGDEGGSYTVSVEFEDIPTSKVMVTVTDPVNGSITMLDGGNNAVNPNSSVDKGSALTIVAVPNRGYKLEWLKAGGEDVTGDFIKVNAAMNIAASFIKEKYEVTNQAPAQVEFSNVTFEPSEFNTPIKNVTASIKEEYKGTHKLISLLLNNQAIANGNNDLLVEGNMNFSALVKKLEPVSIQNERKTEVVYNGNAYVYTVKTAANLSDFKVTFKDKNDKEVVAPSTVGTYKVIIIRDADDLYAAYKNETDYTLEIKPGMPGVLDIPFTDKLGEAATAATTTVAGEWLDQAAFNSKYPNREPATKAGGSSVIYFVPADDNMGYIKTTSVASSQADQAKTVTITYATNAGDHGTVSVENDFVSVAKTYSGLTLTLNAKADAGYKVNWDKITLTDGGTLNQSNHTFTVSNNVTVSVAAEAFTQMSAPTTPTNVDKNIDYTGSSLAYSPFDLGLATDVAWKIQYVKQSNNTDTYTTTDPIDAGTYKIKVSCDNGTDYSALGETEIGKITINPQVLTANNIQVPNASPVAKNAMLSTSILDTNGKVIDAQGNPVPGQFTWYEDKAIEKAGEQDIDFAPSDANNYSVNGLSLKSYVSLKGVATYLMTVKVENGNASNLIFTDATGKVINPATDKVPAGMKLFITTTSGTIGDVSVVGANATAGGESISGEPKKWYCIAGSEAFTVTITFKSGSEGGGGDTPGEGTAVTGISLNKTTLTLPRLKSEKLVATVTPTGATKKDVKWTSTDPAVASVDADGTVKALKVGRTTIIATTVDGGFTAMCQVTVDFATAIEKILSESLVYSRSGQIIIEPAAPVEVSIINLGGQVIYNNSISSAVQVPANSGLYIVRMSAAGKATTTKVIVR
ncbi:Ig-like domain-containing protein [uncultured Parabacteroides sp.]|uniref:Ig-like domain-containing protein n=1 Tax=uncultured Parabacteroides sp. TaxID=512312 RepID=UPI0025DFDCA4|nr:Ig-like domain-containing protein [uncultured Parabacteroides sp.]